MSEAKVYIVTPSGLWDAAKRSDAASWTKVVLLEDHEAIREADQKRHAMAWIPVSERLPVTDGRYAIVYRYGSQVRMFTGDYLCVENRWMTLPDGVEVIYWCEYPEIPS
jgi:hypothetical protein